MQKQSDDAEHRSSDNSHYAIDNPEEFARNMLRAFEEGGRALSEFLERPDGKMSPYSAATEFSEATKTISEVFVHWMAEPTKVAEAQASLIQSYAELWNNCARRMMGDDVPPLIEPEPGDGRFKDEEWSTNPYFDFWKQSYLLTSSWVENILEDTQGLDKRKKQKAEYYIRQLTSALSPSNFPFTNPEIMRETVSTNARNLVEGMQQLSKDMHNSGDLLKISQTDLQAFEVGKNIATTPGKIVFQNEIIQLIQYSPTTDKVREVPLLVIPPWINKYYILDLTPSKSFIKFTVDQGFTLFVISWVNPDESLSHRTFEDYMHDGILAAAEAVRRETGVEHINALGYCVGGTLLATTLAYLAAHNKDVFQSATFLTTQVDFTDAGDLLVFIDDAQLKNLEEMMAERGFLDGSRMASVFNMMRPRDLVWPYIVNNYLLGKKPLPFDLLYWNQDSTRMPAHNHAFYLRQFYHENRLAKGEMELSETKLDLHKVEIPIFELATREDHIAPAKSVFVGAQKFGGPVEFVLAGSGHIAGVVNPPEKMKYQYWTSTKFMAATFEDWIDRATENPGSWWPYWSDWLSKNSGDWIPPREPGLSLGVIEEAPGSYVRVKA